MAPLSLVVRIRAIGLFCFVLAALLMLLNTKREAQIGTRIEKIAETSAPLADIINELPLVGVGLHSAISQIAQSNSQEEIMRLERRVGELVHLGRTLLSEIDQIDLPLLNDTAMLDDLAARQIMVLVQRHNVDTLATHEADRLERVMGQFREKQDALSLELSNAAQNLSTNVLSHQAQQLTLSSSLSNNLTALYLLTRSLALLPPETAQAQKPLAVRELDAFVTGLTRLQTSANRQAIAAEIVAYREALFEEAGIFDGLQELQTRENRRDESLIAAHARVDSLSDWLHEAEREAVTEFQQVSVETSQLTSKMIRFNIISNFLLWAACLFLLWWIVEKNLFSRLVRLTWHVRAFGMGDFSDPVRVTGKDEIGEIEQAVETSRLLSERLAEKNEELERFAYVAAHDLRSPLRAVADLVAWSREDYGDKMDKGLRDNLDLIDGRIERLSGHLNGLLDYARAGQTEEEREVFHLDSFVEKLQAHYVDRPGFQIELAGEPPPVKTYVAPLETILLNLVSNAVKHHDRSVGRITLSLSVEEDACAFRVQDDGPGIPRQYQERVFVLFQTLQPRDVVEGTGLGLALVQKLATSLGGTVEVLSEPDTTRGATFTLRIPFGRAAEPLEKYQRDVA
ncbi:MAG: HAMP domain-containing sensor histidine kinase [Pseudomonadota bacterium]